MSQESDIKSESEKYVVSMPVARIEERRLGLRPLYPLYPLYEIHSVYY